MDYYVATEDGNHFIVFEETELIFEALAAYYQAINDGSEGIYLEIELGYKEWIDKDEDEFEYEPMSSHSFGEPSGEPSGEVK